MFSGSIVALITPLTGDGLDEKALIGLVRRHLEHGTQGIVPVGTTGESSTLTDKEHKRVIEIVVHETGGQVPVIAGAGSNNTIEAMAYTHHAAAVGADAVLHVMGYYNRPNQEGMFQHFNALSEMSELPIVVYNVPARAVVDIEPETMARIAQLENVIGVKDATGDLTRPLKERRLIVGDFCFLTGEDQTAVAYNANGGHGCVSVTANVAPKLCAELQAACASHRYKDALEIQLKLMPLHEALFKEPSPAGVKYACSLLGLSGAFCRLPMVALTEATKKQIESAMDQLELH